MKIVRHKNIPSIEHDGSDFEVDGRTFRIIGTERREDGKYYLCIKNVKTGTTKEFEHTQFCKIIEKMKS